MIAHAPSGSRPTRLPRLLWLGGAVLLAAALRFYQLESIPGFGYDEGTIARLGRQIVSGDRFAVGIQPYFGPLLIYLIAASYKLFGVSIIATRLPVALLSSLMPLAAHLLAREVTGRWKAGVAAAYLVAVSPWHVFFGRFAWDGNISPLFLTLYYYLLLAASRESIGARRRMLHAGGAFLCLGLTLNGHPYLVLPAAAAALVVFVRMRPGRLLILASAPAALLPLLPVVGYQVATGFQILDRFFGGYGHHFALSATTMDGAELLERFRAYHWSLAASLNGTYLYPDLYKSVLSEGIYLPAVLFAAGLALAAWRSRRHTGDAVVTAATLAAMLTLPLIVKSQFFEKLGRVGTFTHYLDGVYPLPYILIVMLFYSDGATRLARRLGEKAASLAVGGLVMLSLLHLKTTLFDYFRESWGNGHFVSGLDQVIQRIDALPVGRNPVQAMTHFTVSSSLYPQFEALTDWKLEPLAETLFEPHPLRADEKIIAATTVFVSRGRDAHYQPLLSPTHVVSSPDGSQKWNIYMYTSPAIFVQGTGKDGAAIALYAHLDSRGDVRANGTVHAKERFYSLEGQRLIAVGKFRSGKTVRILGTADDAEEFVLTMNSPGEPRKLSLRIGGREMFESFQGTLCIY